MIQEGQSRRTPRLWSNRELHPPKASETNETSHQNPEETTTSEEHRRYPKQSRKGNRSRNPRNLLKELQAKTQVLCGRSRS